MMTIRLRDVTDDDLPVFFEQQRDPDANQMAAFPARDWDAFKAHWSKILGGENVTIKTILFAEHVAGNIVCWEEDGKRLVGYWIGKSYWGKGVTTRALSEFVGVVKARPLYAHVAKQNIASIRVLEKCGFTICDEETKALDEPRDGVEEFVFTLCKRPDSIQMVIPMLVCRDGASEIDFCKTAFGAVELSRRSGPDGNVVHATLKIAESVLMIHGEFPPLASRAPPSDGSSSVVIYIYVDDVDAVTARAVVAGARVLIPVANQFWGDRVGRIIDPAGHVWNISTRIGEASSVPSAVSIK